MRRAASAVAVAASAAALAGALGCAGGPGAAPHGGRARPAAEILSCFDLPRRDPRSHNLSGLAWDDAEHRLYAISDRDRWLVEFAPLPGFAGFELQPTIPLDIDVEPWDGEALALAGDRFLVVASENVPAVFSVDRAGHGAKRIELPQFHGMRENLGLEGIAYAASAEGRYLFAVNEQALEADGPPSTTTHGTRVRLVRHSLDGGPDVAAVYLTDPIFTDGVRADNGVSDLAALSPDRLLVLERGYVRGRGNAVRIYAVDLRGAAHAAADAHAAAPLAKRLVADLATIADGHCSTPPNPQRRRTLDNFEGLALGPPLPDGRRLVFLVSDDNERPSQVPRLVTLAIPPGAL